MGGDSSAMSDDEVRGKTVVEARGALVEGAFPVLAVLAKGVTPARSAMLSLPKTQC